MDFLAGGQFNLIVLFPVVAVVASVVLVFLFGFKQPDELKFKKSSAAGADSNKKPKKKDAKKPVTNGLIEKSSSPNEPAKKERTTEAAAKKSPTKEVKPKKAPVSQESVKKDTKSKAPVKGNKKDKVKAENVSAEKKPDDFDDGNWFTVPTKSEKKKPKIEDVTNSPKPAKVEPSIVEKKNAKNAKQLKDQANKTKKEAEDAAATLELKSVEQIIAAPVITEAVAKPKSIVIDDDEKQTAEIIEKIQEAIVDVVIEPVTVQKEIVSKSISKKIIADREEKVDEIKPVETNVAFDELADAWTDAKPTKKNKKKVRKD